MRIDTSNHFFFFLLHAPGIPSIFYDINMVIDGYNSLKVLKLNNYVV